MSQSEQRNAVQPNPAVLNPQNTSVNLNRGVKAFQNVKYDFLQM